jgi:carboxypeptidase family protein
VLRRGFTMRRVFPAHQFIVAFVLIFSSLNLFPLQAAAQADPRQHGLSDILIIDGRRTPVETEPGPPPAITKISGIVINAVTGEPLPRALVTIESEQLAMLTGADGRFEFSRVYDREATPSAGKPGFLNDEQAQPENVRYGIGSRIVQKGETFTIPLTPAGLLTGRVLDSNGEPMEGVVVTPIASIVTNGRRSIQPRTAATTRKNGVFTIDSLPPGSYFLEVAPRAASMNHDKRGIPSLEAPPGADYPPVIFYPGVTDFSTAVALDIRPGATVQADFTLAMAPAFRISGRITGQRTFPSMTLSLVHSSGQKMELRNEFDTKTGAFAFMNVPAGEYRLVAECVRCAGTSRYGETPVIVSSVDVKVNLAVKEFGYLMVEVKEDSPSAPEAQDATTLDVRLIPIQPLGQAIPMRLFAVAGGDMVTPNAFYVPPGTYRVEFIPGAPLHIASVSYGGQNLLREDLTVRADSTDQQLQIVVRRDGAMLSGTVQPEVKPAGAVLLVPRSPALQARVARIDKDNQYQLEGVAPGEYDLFAFDQIDNLEYHDPSFLRAYEDRARHVSLHANQTESVPLDLISRRN